MINRRYTKAFREQAMKLVTEKEYGVATAARELGIPESTLTQWLKKAGWQKHVENESPVSEDPKVLMTEVLELRRRVKRLEMEKEILKKRRRSSPTRTREVRVYS
jgi:transposase